MAKSSQMRRDTDIWKIISAGGWTECRKEALKQDLAILVKNGYLQDLDTEDGETVYALTEKGGSIRKGAAWKK